MARKKMLKRAPTLSRKKDAETQTEKSTARDIYEDRLLTNDEWTKEILPREQECHLQKPDQSAPDKSDPKPLSFWQSLTKGFRKGAKHHASAKDEDKRSGN